jgi:hypothetical protein
VLIEKNHTIHHHLIRLFRITIETKILYNIMKNLLILSIALTITDLALGQKERKFHFDGIQLNVGGVMNSKLSNNDLFGYSNYVYSADSTILLNGFTPNTKSDIRMTPAIGLNFLWSNEQKHTKWRLGVYYNRKYISSFGVYNNSTYDTLTGQWTNNYNEVRLSHTAPLMTFDLSWFKAFSVNERLSFNLGLGGYLGSSLGNNILVYSFSDQYAPINSQYQLSYNTFQRFSLNGGAYALIGFDYALNGKKTDKQNWFLTYETRFGGDYFMRRGYAFQGLSYQNTHLIGLKYKFSKATK